MRSSRVYVGAVSVSSRRAQISHSLPFEPMALITLDKLQECLGGVSTASTAHAASPSLGAGASRRARQSAAKSALLPLTAPPSTAWVASSTWSSKESASAWFQRGLPFFVSPKHDGIRLVSYAPPPKVGQRGEGSTRLSRTPTTCFSRHGRPIHNLRWIEAELALLRAVAGDSALALDAELYSHKAVAASSAPVRASPNARRRQRTSARRKVGQAAAADGAEVPRDPTAPVKTGFLAVNALVTRLRCGSSRCATIGDVLQYVDALPAMCVFDVISYNPSFDGPSPSPSAGAGRKGAREPDWVRECARVRREAMAAHSVRHVACLQCIPNITPFSQRVRTLYFLADLLARAVRSPVLAEHFELTPPPSDKTATTASSSDSLTTTYAGGHYVKAVPYVLSDTLKTVEAKMLPGYTARGYEGIVVRAPNNLYELREKHKGVVQTLVKPVEEQARKALQRARGQTAEHARRASPRQLLTCHRFCLEDESARSSKGPRGSRSASHSICRAYTTDDKDAAVCPSPGKAAQGCRRGGGSAAVRRVAHPGDDLCLDAVDPRVQEESEALDMLATTAMAVSRARELPPRSFSVAKVLPFQDTEYTVLRPLLKAPSTNPRTRPLASMKTDKGVVAFYGLQCLAENGRVFNVSLPKMKMADQQALLKHLTSVMDRKGKRDASALTGLYVTVKYGALTEHGVPRFGTVKAIRGGKGWFL